MTDSFSSDIAFPAEFVNYCTGQFHTQKMEQQFSSYKVL